VAIVKSSCVMSFHKGAVAKWIASSVPSSAGIDCEARSNTIASIAKVVLSKTTHLDLDRVPVSRYSRFKRSTLLERYDSWVWPVVRRAHAGGRTVMLPAVYEWH
jgi:hypothetical protein